MKKNTTAFWDASALVPLCVQESTSREAAAYLQQFSPAVWWGAIVEIHSAICRLCRERTITDAGKNEAIARVEKLNRTWREISAGESLRGLALDLLGNYPLKAADSLQLAASLIWCEQRPARRTFVCSDKRLSEAARSVGFAVLELSQGRLEE